MNRGTIAILRSVKRHSSENIMTKDKLLAVGDKYEAMIAADKAADAEYR